jgi:hypothetical protein
MPLHYGLHWNAGPSFLDRAENEGRGAERSDDRREGGSLLPGILELGCGLLNAEDNGVRAPNADGGVALADSLESVLHLEEVSIGGEDSDGAVIAGHPAGIAGG